MNIREQPPDRKAGLRSSSRNIPDTIGSFSASVKHINCRCEKIANFEEKVNALEKIVSDHTNIRREI